LGAPGNGWTLVPALPTQHLFINPRCDLTSRAANGSFVEERSVFVQVRGDTTLTTATVEPGTASTARAGRAESGSARIPTGRRRLRRAQRHSSEEKRKDGERINDEALGFRQRHKR